MNRCATCPRNHRQVQADGPIDAKVFAIGEAPGYDEDEIGRPFVGRAGREFNEHYLRLAGLDRDEIYLTNTVQCRPDQNRKPRYAEVWGCAPNHIPAELERVAPEVVILMGATACSLLERWGGKPDLDAEHGIPRKAQLFDWSGWVVPMYHPAAGLHDTGMMTPLMEDWEALRLWLEDGTWVWASDEIKRDYQLLESKGDVDKYFAFCGQWYVKKLVGCDTESHAGQEFSVQISIAGGTGGLVLWKNKEVITYLAKCVRDYADELLFHYAPADQPMFEAMGLGEIPYRDTLQEAYGLLLPQALKTLSRRLLGRTRLSWEETVTPPSKKVLAKWMRAALKEVEGWQITTPRAHKKTGKPLKPTVKVSESEKVLISIYNHMVGNPEYDIWKRLRERMPRQELEQLEAAMRWKVPVKGVAHLSIEELVEYGCSDADDTLTLALMFERMRGEFVVGLNLQDEDVDS